MTPNPLEYIEAVAKAIEAGYDLATAKGLAAEALGISLALSTQRDADEARRDDWTWPP